MDLSALCQGFHAAERACVKDVCPESISVAGHITVWVHSNEHSIVRTISHASPDPESLPRTRIRPAFGFRFSAFGFRLCTLFDSCFFFFPFGFRFSASGLRLSALGFGFARSSTLVFFSFGFRFSVHSASGFRLPVFGFRLSVRFSAFLAAVN